MDHKRLRVINPTESESLPVGLVSSTTNNSKCNNTKPVKTPITAAFQRGIDLIRNSPSPQPKYNK